MLKKIFWLSILKFYFRSFFWKHRFAEFFVCAKVIQHKVRFYLNFQPWQTTTQSAIIFVVGRDLTRELEVWHGRCFGARHQIASFVNSSQCHTGNRVQESTKLLCLSHCIAPFAGGEYDLCSTPMTNAVSSMCHKFMSVAFLIWGCITQGFLLIGSHSGQRDYFKSQSHVDVWNLYHWRGCEVFFHCVYSAQNRPPKLVYSW